MRRVLSGLPTIHPRPNANAVLEIPAQLRNAREAQGLLPMDGFLSTKTIMLGGKVKRCPNLTPDGPQFAGATYFPSLPKKNSARPSGAPCRRRFLCAEMA